MSSGIQGALRRRLACASLFASLLVANVLAHAENRNLAPDFHALPMDAKVVVMPVDVELFSISAGGVLEPKADWTASAQRYIREALNDEASQLHVHTVFLKEEDADDFGEQMALHAAVASSISLHHMMGGRWALPSKHGNLDWSFGDAMKGIEARTGARYGLFSWVRDSYASAQRKAAMVMMAMLGVGITGGAQVGYASLVDLDTGEVLWFNQLRRGSGDLREEGAAKESVHALLSSFPGVQ